ncbi:pentatricopeptide repeat-containing protein At1g59720, chloroplastic/mitochondrial-like [Vicia villosa]|uniref:pentatricopeptide repeat-containing protein At1g59720, chloroplastic/mitochondrial-like n=1 Tax=Vicia villosa TaxID=3911 RepID=UPI00273B4F04|nr:pentatricopeptide repeat-containing protein At1g59720, chloroplastic/mitochondrial-like [Vicia villosa]
MSPKPTSFWKAEQTLINLFKHCSTPNHLKQIHARIILTGFHHNLILAGKIIMFSADISYALSVFHTVHKPDAFLWNTMIRGFGNSTLPLNAIHFYKRMQLARECVVPDNFTFSFLLKIVARLGSVTLGKQLHCSVFKFGLESHVYVRNSLMHMYGMVNDIKGAHHLFEEMREPDLVAWNSIIDCHVYCGNYNEALDLFTRMQLQLQPDDATLVVILSACGAIGALDFGRKVHLFIRDNINNLGESISVFNALVDMYAKCGAVEEAYETFSNMKRKNLVSWNVMILGLASHGNGEEALLLFTRMLQENVERPNDVTFLGVLCACSHGGLVDEGRRYFDIMNRDYNIQPTIKHYGCMVDLLGRAGLVVEAYELIKNMPVECNAIIWRTLLAACRNYGNVELGEKVRKHLLELEPDHSSDYVLLANMYASTDQWNEMTNERRSMQERRVRKPEPGNSFIGIPGMKLEKESVERLS